MIYAEQKGEEQYIIS